MDDNMEDHGRLHTEQQQAGMDSNSTFSLEIRLVGNARSRKDFPWFAFSLTVDSDTCNFKDFVDEIVDKYPPGYKEVVSIEYPPCQAIAPPPPSTSKPRKKRKGGENPEGNAKKSRVVVAADKQLVPSTCPASPAMCTRSKTSTPHSPSMGTRSKRKLLE